MSSQKILKDVFSTPGLRRQFRKDSENFLRDVGVVITEENGSRVKYAKDGVVLAIHRTSKGKALRPLNFIEKVCTKKTPMNALNYKEYIGTVEYNHEEDCLFGRILGINDIVTFEGQSVKELRVAFEGAVDDYIAQCKLHGKEPLKPYSGKFVLRIDPALHSKLATHAQMQDVSLNQYVYKVLEDLHKD